MNVEAWKKGTTEYIDNTILIRKLSSTQVVPEYSQQEYYEELRDHFVQIRGIAEQNKKILNKIIYPCLNSDELLSDDMADAMNEFIDALINGFDIQSLDTILAVGVAERLLTDAHQKQDVSNLIRRLDTGLIVYYTAYNMLNRAGDFEALGDEYRVRGLEIGREILTYIEKDRFADLPNDECKELVLINSRYLTCFYETKNRNPEKAAAGIEHLKWAAQIMDDPFYHEHAPGYDWFYHKVRLCEYACTMTQIGNIKGLTEDHCLALYPYALMLDSLIGEDIPGLITAGTAILLSSRVKYYAGKMSSEEYLRILLKLYKLRKKDSYYIDDIYLNLIVPVEYLAEVKKLPMPTEENYSVINSFYRDIVRYISRTQNDDTLGASLEYYADFLNNFIEYPGGMPFYDVVMLSLAGLHLPTYVHSNMVGKISLCIARHLLQKNPAYFTGLWGMQDVREIRERSQEILNYIYHGGTLHDAGKLFIIDTVFVYGRKLVDAEFNIIKNHPDAGSTLLLQYPSTMAYAPIAIAHHKLADNKGGYPAKLDMDALPEKALVKIVTIADSMDAATDSVGRSYGKGISLDQYIDEVWNGRGTRYDAAVAALLKEDEDLYRDLVFILNNERQALYYKSYDLMFKNFKED